MIRLGPESIYTLSEAAMQHIVFGDISRRQDRDATHRTKLTPVIAGGLHTFEGAQTFLKLRPDIHHGLYYEPAEGHHWYYGRALQNGVILLKIPREAFQSKAAKLTEFPETYYKSGYLWKTLFPKGYTQKDIVKAIDEALSLQDEAESSDGLIIGYTKNDDPFKVLKIRIQVRGYEIMSAFPTWSQPMTGNNGKPFSHIEAINTVISASCVFLLGEDDVLNSYAAACDHKKLEELYLLTPRFFLKRNKAKADDRIGFRVKRNQMLRDTASTLNEEEIENLIALITKVEYLRYPFVTMNAIYSCCYSKIKRFKEYENAIALYQNLYESLIVLSHWDLSHGTTKAYDVIIRLLQVHFVNTGGLDQWELKRLSNLIMNVVGSYNRSDIICGFLSALSMSPVRIAFFVEFNVNTFFNSKIEIIGLDDYWEKPMLFKHYIQYVVQNLGINYTYNFSDDFNVDLATKIQDQAGTKSSQMISEIINYAVAKDFNLFISSFSELIQKVDIDAGAISVIKDILYDYHRTLAANVQRILVKHRKLFSVHPDDYEFGTSEHYAFSKAKHEHRFLSTMKQLSIEQIATHIGNAGFAKEPSDIIAKYTPMLPEVEKIPMPKSVPGYVE